MEHFYAKDGKETWIMWLIFIQIAQEEKKKMNNPTTKSNDTKKKKYAKHGFVSHGDGDGGSVVVDGDRTNNH